MRGQLERPLGLMDILENVWMQAWQGKTRKPSLPSPGAERLCLSSGLAVQSSRNSKCIYFLISRVQLLLWNFSDGFTLWFPPHLFSNLSSEERLVSGQHWFRNWVLTWFIDNGVRWHPNLAYHFDVLATPDDKVRIPIKIKLTGAPARLVSFFILFGGTAFPGNDE